MSVEERILSFLGFLFFFVFYRFKQNQSHIHCLENIGGSLFAQAQASSECDQGKDQEVTEALSHDVFACSGSSLINCLSKQKSSHLSSLTVLIIHRPFKSIVKQKNRRSLFPASQM